MSEDRKEPEQKPQVVHKSIVTLNSGSLSTLAYVLGIALKALGYISASWYWVVGWPIVAALACIGLVVLLAFCILSFVGLVATPFALIDWWSDRKKRKAETA